MCRNSQIGGCAATLPLVSLMPPRIDWRETAEAAEADVQLAALKSYVINKSDTMVYTVCGSAEPHNMRYRLVECGSDTCYEASDMKCAWRGKLLTCLQTHLISIYEFGEHTTDAAAPKRIKLTETQKAFCREMAENHLRPMRIRHALSRKFTTPLDALPSLKAVQNFVNHYARTYLENHDRVDELRKWIHARNYTGTEEITQPFTFGWELDGVGKPVVGNGSGERPFIIGISTKELILRMLLPPD